MFIVIKNMHFLYILAAVNVELPEYLLYNNTKAGGEGKMTEYIILMPLGILLFGLTPVVRRDPYLNKSQKNIMTGIIALISLVVVQNVADYILQQISFPYLRTLVSILGYCIRPVIIVLFCKLVKPDAKTKPSWALVIFNAAVYMTAAFSPVVFFIDENNHYRGGILGGQLSNIAYIVCLLLLAHLVYCTVTEYRIKKTWLWIVFFNIFIVVASMVLEISPAYRDYPVSYVTIAVVCCSFFFYVWLHLKFVHDHEQALMAEQRIKIMMSQIQPHFLYNTLATIQSLCLTEPRKAAAVTGKFGAYLRKNLESLEKPDLIPLQEELEHTSIYADIEMVRFPKISVEYNIEADDFSVPALTIQPLVENAIRYGVRNRAHGIVEVTTRKTDDSYVIIISDNGTGFDTDALKTADSSHIGIRNVKERIEKMCHGTLEINSRINEGTTITITIPRREE